MAKVNPPSSPLSVLQRRSPIATLTFLAVLVGAPALSLWLLPRQYEATARLSVGEQDAGISGSGQAPTNRDRQPPERAVDPVAIEAERLKFSQVIERALKMVQRKKGVSIDQLPTVQQVRDSLTVSIVPATNILQISLRGTDPGITSNLLNALIEAAVADNVESTRKEAETLRKSIEDRVSGQLRRLQLASTAEAQYRERNGIVAIENQAQALATSIAALEDEERRLRAQLQENAIENSTLRQVTGINSPTSAYNAVRAGQTESLKALQRQVAAMDAAVADARSRLGDEHPDVLALLQKRDELQDSLEKQLAQGFSRGSASATAIATPPITQELATRLINNQVERQAIGGRLSVVQSEIQQLRTTASQFPQLQKTLADLTRERQAAEEGFKVLNRRLEEARIAESEILSTLRVVELANIPVDSVSPKLLELIAISAIAGLLLAGALVALLEVIDTSFHTAAEAEALIELPVLGNLPKLPPSPPDFADLQRFLDTSEQVEPYRSLLKNLEAISDRKRKVIVISSVNAGEGKSATVLHLAATAAMHSRRTLIIDADLRHPLQHRLLNVTAYPGLTEVISDHLPCWNAIRSTPIQHLSVLPYGRLVQRPSVLIDTIAISRLLNEVSAHFDLVIVDAAPLGLCADAASLSQAADGIVVVIQPNVTPRNQVLSAIAELRKMGQNPLGLVMNETVLTVEKEPPIFLPLVSQPNATIGLPL